MSLADLLGGGATETTALAPTALRDEVRERVSVDAPLPGVRAQQRKRIADVVEYLELRGETRRDDLVAMFFEGDGVQAPDQARYVDGRRWFRDLAAPALEGLPFVDVVDPEATVSTWRFTGADPDALLIADRHVDDDAIGTLAEIRAAPEYRVRGVLDELGIARRSDEREAIRTRWDRLRARGEATADELDLADPDDRDDDSVAADLIELPGVTRTVDEPDPEEIAVDTLADVIEGRERLEAGAIERWRYDPEAATGDVDA